MRSRVLVSAAWVCSIFYSFCVDSMAAESFIEELVAANKPAVLVIEGVRNDGAVTQSSGCVVHKSGLILTTAHQVDNVKELRGRQSDGTTYALSVLEVDVDRELALLRADKEFNVSAAVGDARTLNAGAMLITIATPVNLDFSVATGIVANTSRTFRGFPVIQAELTAAPGSSGGPVFNRKGEVIGLIMGVLEEQNWATIVIPVNNAFSMLERHGLYQTTLPDESHEQELTPASGITTMELHALEAYNKGTQTTDIEEKKTCYNRAVELLPDFYEAWFNLAVTLGRNGDLDSAFPAYEKAINLRQDSVEARRNLGLLYLETEAYEKAIALFEAVVEIRPAVPQSFNDLGEAYRKAGKYELAVDAFNRALSLDENYANALYNLAMTHVQQNQWEHAYDAFERYLASAPDAADRVRVENWMQKIKEQLQ